MTYYNWRGEPMPETEPEQGRISGTSAGNETINAPDAPGSSLSGEGGGDLLVGNSHGNRFWITDTRDRVDEPANGGVDTMIGWTSLKAAPNIENLQVNGAFNFAYGNELSNLIVVDDQSHWIYGGAGDDVMVGAATAKTTFVVRAGEGNDVIYNWQGNDQLQLWGYGFTSAADIKAAMSQVGSDVVLQLSAGETLTFRDETLASFQDRQFLLPLDMSKLGAITFEDEFNSLSIWDPNTGTGTWKSNYGGNLKDPWAYTLTSNGERQVYIQPDFYGQGEQAAGVQPLTVADGVLTITASRIPDDQRDAAWGREYYSGMVNTLGTFEQQYGYFEMRADLPEAVGTWPAFWLMPTPYVAQTEADIMEGLAATPLVDYRRAWGGGDNLYDNALKIDPDGFHTYGMLWTPQTVTFYYDGVAVLQAPTPDAWTHPMGMIVNMAVGGWGGEPNSLQFPDSMQVDYVRVYNLADNSAVIEQGTPELPVATLKPEGGQTSGAAEQPLYFDQDGQPLSAAKIAVYTAKPTDLPPGKTFVIWEDSGAVFGAVSDGDSLGEATGLMAGSSSVFTGSGTWLTDGKVALGYMATAITGNSAWVMIFDPSDGSFTRHQLGVSTGDIDFVAMENGNFAASWEAPDGTTHARAYDGWAYDGKGWFGPERQISGDLQGYATNGDLIAQSGSGQQLYSVNNPPPGVDAIVSIGPMAGVSHPEGDAGATAYTFTLTRDFDLSQKTTVAWTVRGQGGAPADGVDFVGGSFPTGVATFEINEASTTITILVQGDAYTEGDEEFIVTLVNPVGAKLGQATATGFIRDDGDAGGPPPPPSGGGGSTTLGFSTGTVTHAEGDSGSTAFTFTVTRAGDTAGTSTVGWSVTGSGSDAASAGDFAGGALPSGTLTFAAGETSKTITVNVAGDTTSEADEGFTVTLSGATGGTLGAATAGGVIANDDSSSPPPSGDGEVINSPGPGSTLTGGAGDDTLNASQGEDVLTGGAGADTFAWAKAPWAPATVTDFVVGTDRLDLSALLSGYSGSDPVADKYIWLLDDGEGGTKLLYDKDGAANGQQWPSYILHLEDVPTAGLTWAQLSGGGSTPPASPQIGFSTTNAVEHGEGNTGSTAYSFTVVRTGSTEGTSTVNWTVSGASANPASASDFTGNAFPSGSLTFAAGETSKVITVNVSGDTFSEPTEGFNVTLSGASGATLGTATAFGVIGNDDTPPPKPGPPQLYLDNAPVSHAEGDSGGTTFSYAVTRSGSTEGASTVNWSVAGSGSNPANGADFQGGALPSGTLTFAAGETSKTLTFTVAGDTTVEADETFTVTLSGASGAGIGGGTSTGTIANDDMSSPPPSGGGEVINSPGPGSTLTGGSGNDTLNASQGPDILTGGAGADTFAWATAPWSPAHVTDFNVGTDRLDLSALLTGYSGSDPVADRYIWLLDDGDGGTKVLLDPDGTGPNPQWPNYIINLDDVRVTSWAQLQGGASTPGDPPPDDPPPEDPPPPSGNPGQTITSPGPGSTLTGTSGDDTLVSSQGDDWLTGGAGADHFVFPKENWSPATITDFEHGVDKIDLRQMFDAVGYTGTDPFADGRIILLDDGEGGTKVLFDKDGPGPNPQWGNYVIHIEGVAPTTFTLSDWMIQ